MNWSSALGLLLGMGAGLAAAAKDVCITDHGAKAGEGIVNTAAIQAAIDACHAAGGGKVILPAGRFVSGTLYLKSHVRLSLEGEAELLGSRSLADYPTNNPGSGEINPNKKFPTGQVLSASEFIQALIVADRAVDVGIEGPGTIDGRGQPDAFPVRIAGQRELGRRPMLMRFSQCRDIHLQDVGLQNPASWGVHLVDCDNVHIRQVKISHRANQNNDGIDIDGCRDVFVADSNISSGDDAVCLKSSHGKPCENVFVNNCVLSSDTAAVKMGTSSRAGFRNIIVSDCVMRDTKMGTIKLECVDGGTLENVLIQNIVMDRVEGPLFIRLGNRGAAYRTPELDGAPVKVGVLRNITISNVRATVAATDKTRSGILITGIPGYHVSGIRLDNIDLRFAGMGDAEPVTRSVPEDERRYPEQFFFGSLPSYGMFLRHAKDVELSRMRFSYSGAEKRPAFVLEDVHGFGVKDSKIQADGRAAVAAQSSSDISVSSCQVMGSPNCLVEAGENQRDKIHLEGNRMPEGTKPIAYRE